MKILIVMTLFAYSLFASVDINTATAKEISTLHGVGIKKAEAIVKYRKSHGCFKNIDALTNVKGIGKKTVTKNKKNLKVGKCKK